MHQEIRAMAGEPEYIRTDVGVKKIPDPIMFPTINVTPFESVIFFFKALKYETHYKSVFKHNDCQNID